MKQRAVKWMIITMCMVCIAWVALYAFTSYATSTSDKVKNAQDSVNQSKKNVQQSKQQVEEMESAKAQLEGRLADLNNELSAVSAQLETAQNELAEKQQAVEQIKVDLAEAEAQEQEQYVSMKKRIQYMYENNNTDVLQLIFESDSFTDMLNSADFFTKMTQYDRAMLEEHTKTKERIAQAKVQLEQEEQALEQTVAEVEEKQQQVSHLVNQTSAEIARQTEDIAEAERRAEAYEQELIAQQNTLQALKEREAQEQAILNGTTDSQSKTAGAASVNYDSNGKVTGNGTSSTSSSGAKGYESASNESDLKLLATIIYCEAGNQPYEGQIAVGSVVMNRINSSRFPNTMLGVLYQKSQFTPVMSGRFAIALANNSATSSCYSAAQEVLNGTNNVPNCLFFRTVIPGINGQIIGAHVFY